jgi:hypothetical protein
MSRGLGKIERQILTFLQGSPRGYETALSLAVEIFDIHPELPKRYDMHRDWYYATVTASQHSVVRRALASLLRKGLVQCSSRHWSKSRRMWALASIEDPFGELNPPTDPDGKFAYDLWRRMPE